MAKTLDMVLIVITLGGWMAMLVYKLTLMHRYRNDRKKLESVLWSDQVFPKRLRRFILDEHNDEEKTAAHHSHH